MAYVGRPHFSLVGIDSGLDSIASLTTAADKMIYTTGADTYAVTPITAFGRSILDDADAAAVRTTLGLGTSSVVDTGTTANKIIQLDSNAKIPAVDGSQITNLNNNSSIESGVNYATTLAYGL